MNIKTTIKQLKTRILEYDDDPLEKYDKEEIWDLVDDISEIDQELLKKVVTIKDRIITLSIGVGVLLLIIGIWILLNYIASM